MRRIGLLVEYDGMNYAGSQRQPNQATIEGRLETAVAGLTSEEVRVRSQGRTDAGVHARGQVVAFDTSSNLPAQAFVAGLNDRLGDDVAVHAACELPEGFDVRRRARSRIYRYLALTGVGRSPIASRWAWVVDWEPDLEAMRQASRTLVGEHNFAAFASPPGVRTNPVRRMLRASVHRCRRLIGFTFEATAFLPQQVRRMVGALMQVGRGALDEAMFRSYLRAPSYAVAGPVAPPQGLYLWRVRYDPPLFEDVT